MPWVERVVGFGLLLGPLAYALTLEPQVVEVVEVVEVAPAPVERPAMEGIEVIPVETVRVVEAPPAPVETPVAEPLPEDRLAFAFVNSAGIVLSNAADPSWGKGRLRSVAGPGEYRAAKPADGTKVPAELWAHRGRSFDLYGANGRLCTVRLGDMFVLAQHDGPELYDLFDDISSEIDWESFDEHDYDAREIRKHVWRRAESSAPWLVAQTIVDEGSCEGALWARDHELPAPVLLHVTDEPTPAAERRLAEHRESEALAQTRADYLAWYAELDEDSRKYETDWATVEQEHGAQVRTWLDAEGQARLVELHFGLMAESCGEGFDSSIRSVDEVTADGFVSTDRSVDPVAIFDANLDGQWEMLYQDESTFPDHLSGPGLSDNIAIDMGFVCPC